MFRFKKIDTFKARVHFAVLGDKADSPDTASFVVEYRHFDREPFKALMDEGLNDAQLIERVVVGFEEFIGPDDKPVDPATGRALVIQDMGVSGAVLRTFIEKHARAPEKNASTSRGR